MEDWKGYDPAWLVELAREQLPTEHWLASALARCTRGAWESRAYVHFVSPNADWQFVRNVILHHPTEGELVLDVLTGNRVGGIEFVDRL